MTEKLFYGDSHLAGFEASVLSCTPLDGGKDGETLYETELDRTAFFPEGGGQYADRGTLTCSERRIRVLDVQERDGRIVHLTDGPAEPGSRVTGRIDWEERFMKMQQHTGEHIVSGLVHARFGCSNVGFHLGTEDCTMDFNGGITEEELREIEREANRAVWKNLPVVTLWPSEEELAGMEYRSKIEIEGQVRIIEIPGYDRCACCAPHVDRTGEIGLIKLTNVQRYKGGVRVTMLCGVRALADYETKQEQAKAVSAMLCAKENETAEAVRHLKEECAALKYGLAEKEKQLVRYLAEGVPDGEGAVCLFPEELEGESMRLLMNRVLDGGHCLCAVFHENGAADPAGRKKKPSAEKQAGAEKNAGAEENAGKTEEHCGKTYRYVIGSRTLDVRELGKALNGRFCGRGGGRPEMVQGTVCGDREEIFRWIMEKAGETA